MATIEAVRGDVTRQRVDAIVNAANEALRQGGGVCGAIFRAAGPGELAAACAAVAPCPTGEARITPAFGLERSHGVRYVIHAVGPVWQGGGRGEPELLRGCYRAALSLAEAHGVRAIAFPSISTGIFGYPVAAAAGEAIAAVREHLRGPTGIELVRFVCFSEADLEEYQRRL
jgi:O-acetyl-ADP-ribose deacetylase (regulator of RNase III)